MEHQTNCKMEMEAQSHRGHKTSVLGYESRLDWCVQEGPPPSPRWNVYGSLLWRNPGVHLTLPSVCFCHVYLQDQRAAPGDGQQSGAGLANGRDTQVWSNSVDPSWGGRAGRQWKRLTTQRSGPRPLGNAPSNLTYKTCIQRQNYKAF